MTLTCIDVCAGAGGLSLGFQRAGFDVLGVELDDIAASVHRRYVGPCETADVSTWSPTASARVTCGGVPCQPFSSAGARKGFDDVRGSLFVHLIRIAQEAQSECIVLENVVGLTNWQGGRALREIQDCYREAGFKHVEWCVLNAADYGVPQKRKRVFIIGFREHVQFEWPVPTHGPSLWATKPWKSVREALGLRGRNGRGRRPGDHYAGMRMLDVDQPSVVVPAKHRQDLLQRLESVSPTISASREALPNAQQRDKMGKALALLEQPGPTITTRAYEEGEDRVRPSRRPNAQLARALQEANLIDRPATVVASRASVAKAGHHKKHQDGAVRLNAKQCAALQDFPPDWGWPEKKADAHRLIGNAVPPRLGEVVGLAIRKALER